MNKHIILILFCSVSLGLFAQKTRVLVTTDLGQDPDDQQSLIRLLHYTDVLEIEGLILNADSNNNYEAPVLAIELADSILKAYEKTYISLKRYGDFTKPEALRNGLKKGSTKNSVHKPIESYIGNNFKTEASAWIIQKVDESSSDRPLHICLWGGGVDLAQALWQVRDERSKAELESFVSKIKTYSISKQDTSIDWIIENFPNLYLILSDNPESSWKASFRGMFLGGNMENTSTSFFKKNIIDENHLTQLYPGKTYTGKNPFGFMKEGDSPSFLFFTPTGLNDNYNASYGSWGGRFQSQNGFLWTDAIDSLNPSVKNAIATVSRWRDAFQADFVMKAQWGNPNNLNPNKPPVPKVKIKEVDSEKEREFMLDASSSFDPNGESLNYRWWVYEEASEYKGEVKILNPLAAKTMLIIPKKDKPVGALHLIISLNDPNGVTRYERCIIHLD